LDDLIAQSLILQAAARDTLISVPDDQVDAELEAVWAERVRSLGSEEALRQAVASAGMTPAQYRASLRQQIVEGQLTQQYMQSQVQATRIPPIEEAEIREVFDRDRSTFGNRPATIAFRQVILVPEPSDSAKAEARAEAERVLGLLQDGGDFADLARRFSADAGSAQAGGNLGWVRQGDTVREFEDALFSLPRGGTSGIVETVFGAHIIRLDRIRGAERSASHILIAAIPGEADVEAARERAAEIRETVVAGTPITDFEGEGERTGLPETVVWPVDELGQLPGAYATELRGAQVGDILGPLEIRPSADEIAFAVIEVTELREAGEYAYEDARDQIRSYLQEQRFRERLIDRLRAETHVEIRW
jgi:parvulin-like peptidyl-prolyl isomerase